MSKLDVVLKTPPSVSMAEAEGFRDSPRALSEACVHECEERIAVYDDGKAVVCKQLAFGQPEQWEHYESTDQLPDTHQRRIAVLNMVPQDYYVASVGIRMKHIPRQHGMSHRNRSSDVYWIVPDP